MTIATALSADLAALTEAADDDTFDHLDLEILLQGFIADVGAAVNSYLAMSITIVVNGYEFSLSTDSSSARDTAAAASLQIPLTALVGTSEGGQLLLYAATPGAFIDLAADLNYSLGLDHTTLALDQHLAWRADDSGMAGLEAYSSINQAIGVLIANGHTTETADTEMHRLADLGGNDLHHAALAILEIPRP